MHEFIAQIPSDSKPGIIITKKIDLLKDILEFSGPRSTIFVGNRVQLKTEMISSLIWV